MFCQIPGMENVTVTDNNWPLISARGRLLCANVATSCIDLETLSAQRRHVLASPGPSRNDTSPTSYTTASRTAQSGAGLWHLSLLSPQAVLTPDPQPRQNILTCLCSARRTWHDAFLSGSFFCVILIIIASSRRQWGGHVVWPVNWTYMFARCRSFDKQGTYIDWSLD